MDMSKSTFKDRLKCYRKLNSIHVNFVNIDLYKLMLKENTLLAGYESIKSNKGATTFTPYPDPIPLTPKSAKEIPGGVFTSWKAVSGTGVGVTEYGVETLSLDGFSRQRLNRLRESLRNESWIPSPAKRIYIPKTGKAKKRLKKNTPYFFEEKIVQATMLMILEAIYEPIFLGTSFGFRPGLGIHDAFKAIDQKYDGMTYAIESDIKGMYDNVNHHTLVALMEKRIKDDRFIRLVWKMLKAGYLEAGKQIVKADIGTPPGSIISPILANIYLHQLDLFMMDRSLDVTKKDNKRRAPVYKDRENIYRDRENIIKVIKLKQKDYSFQSRENYLKEFLKFENFGVRLYCDPSNRVHYTRYGDKFIVGIAGSLEFANHLKEAIARFLSTLGLYLNLEKTKVTDIRKDFAFFLGHRITIDTSINHAMRLLKKVECFLDTDRVTSTIATPTPYPIPFILDPVCSCTPCHSHPLYTFFYPDTATPYLLRRGMESGVVGVQSGVGARVQGYSGTGVQGSGMRCKKAILGVRCQDRLVSIEAPIDRIIQRLSAKRFCDNKGTPIAKALWITQEDNQIVQNFNAILRGVFGFYSGVKKRRYLQRIWYILKFSCALTFAAKHRCSLNKIFLKHGQLLRVHFGASGERQVTLYQPSFKEKDQKWEDIA